jgi:hypothetical protein
MRTSTRRKKSKDAGEDLWAWAERQEIPAATLREEPVEPVQPGWYRGILKKISGQKE